jgi:hypothetical protein
VFEAVYDAVQVGTHACEYFTRAALCGTAAMPGFMSLITLKWKLRNHIITMLLPMAKCDNADLARISEATRDYATYRLQVEGYTGPVQDSQWIGSMKESSQLALDIIKDTYKVMNQMRVMLGRGLE